jgi:hypothetical protein
LQAAVSGKSQFRERWAEAERSHTDPLNRSRDTKGHKILAALKCTTGNLSQTTTGIKPNTFE